MSLFPKMNRTLLGTSVAALGAGVCLAAIAQQPPREPPRQPDRPVERPGDRAGPTHTAVVVDLMSYIKKTEEHEQRQRQHERPPRDAPDRPTPPPRDPGTPPGTSASSEAAPPPPPPPGRDQPRDRGRDRDRGIDWTAVDYRDNLEAGVPMVLMIEEDSPWGAGEKRPHVVAFDPNDSDGKESFRKLKNAAGQRVEVSGDVHKQRAIRGLRVLTVKDVH